MSEENKSGKLGNQNAKKPDSEVQKKRPLKINDDDWGTMSDAAKALNLSMNEYIRSSSVNRAKDILGKED